MNMLDLIFDWLIQASLRASILTVVVLVTQHLLREHLSARVLHALWLPVLIVTLMPVWPQSRWSAESLIMEARPVTMSSPAVPAEPTSLTEQAPAVVQAEQSLPGAQMAAFTWAAGSAGFIIAGLISLRSTLRRFRHTASTPEAETVDMVASLARQIGLRHTPRICQSDTISSPAVAGLFRPVLLLPANFAQTFTAHEAELVLKHELMHLQRGDLIMNALLCVLMALHWFNPLLWLAFHKARIDREAACDEDVLRHGSPDERCVYGHALLKAESAFCPRGWSLGFVGIFDRGAGLRTRIRAIASPGSRHPHMKLLACILMALMTYLGSTQAQQSKTEDTEPLITLQVKVVNIPSSTALNFFTMNTTVKQDFMSTRLASGILDTQIAALSAKGGASVVSAPQVATPSGQEARFEVKEGGEPFSKDAPFMGTRGRLLPTLLGNFVSLDVDIEHATSPGQINHIQTKETLESGTSLLLREMNAGKGGDSFQIYIITPVWTPSDNPLVKKMQSITIPRVQFRDASLEEALEFFRVKARELDTAERDASKRGVNIVLETNEASKVRIALDLVSVPLEQALRYTTELANLNYSVNGSAVVLTTRGKKASGGQGKTAATKGGAEDKAKQMILPKVKFNGASLEQALDLLKTRMRMNPDMAGISIVLSTGAPKASITLDLQDVPLWDALRYVSELGGMTLAADDKTITLSPR